MAVITFDDIGTKQKTTPNRIITFDDVEVKKKPVSKAITFENIPTKKAPKEIEEYGEIRKPRPLEFVKAGLKRKGALGARAIIGDIPYLRKALPKRWKETKPVTGAEKAQFPITRLARDIALYAGTSGIVGAAAKIPKIAKAGQIISKIPKVGKAITTLAPEFAKGAIFGGAVAETEKPKEIAKKAAQMGTVFAGVPIALKGLKKVALPITTRLAKIIKPKLSPIKSKVVGLIRKRYTQTQEGLLDSEIFIRSIEKGLTKQQREIIPFIREKTVIPKKLNRPDLMVLMKKEGHLLKPYAEKIGSYLDDAHKFLVENYGDDVGFWENYLPHLWDIPKNKMKQTVNWFVTRNPHLKKRYIATMQEGINKFNLKPKTLDIATILRVYDQYKVKAISNLKFAKGLTGLVGEEGKKVIQRIDKAPTDWVTIDHPALRRAMGRVIGKDKAKILMLNKVPVKVHPEIANEIKVVLDRPFSGAGVRAADTINAFVKKANLSFSLFHHVALTETAIATPTVGRQMLKLWNPVKAWKAIKTGNYGVFEKIPLSKDAVRHGLQIGAISDVQVGKVRTALANLERITKSVPVVGKITKKIRSFNTFWDKALWDYYHTSLKLYGYEGLVQRGLKTHPKLPAEVVKKEVAQFVNDTFGGQAWDLLLKSPKWRQGMHWLLLSPDWTLSTVRQAMSPTGAGAVTQLGRTLRAEMGEKFWHKGIIYFYGGMNLLNKGFTEVYTGKGRYMWENAPDHKTHLFIGLNPDGTEKYLRWGKQFRELPEFFINPVKKAWSKVSPIIRMLQTQVRPSPIWQREFYGKPFYGKEALMGRVKALGKGVLPYSVTGTIRAKHPLGMAFPISKGMSSYKARELFKQAIQRKDKNALREIYASALNNNLDAKSLFKQARTAIKSDITFEFKKEAQKIIEKLKRLGKEKGRIEFEKMKKSGEITPELNKQLVKILKLKKSVKTQKEKMEELRKK